MNPPAISVSMADAANTRENEGPCICDDCPVREFGDCDGSKMATCLELEAEAAGEAQMEARRDER
jgi:hypothetical protein